MAEKKGKDKSAKVKGKSTQAMPTGRQEKVLEKSKKLQKQQPQTMEELLEATGYTLKGIKKGDIITGTVTGVSPKEVTVDVGGKTEGVVIDRELESYKDALMALKVGDMVTAQVIVAENDRGQSVLSLRRSIFEKRWKDLEEKRTNGELVDIILKESVRGGMLVDYGGLRGYVPQSQLEQGLAKQLDKAIGKRVRVKVMEVDQETNRLIFSQRAVMEEETLAKQKLLLSAVHVGDTVEAKITGVVAFGAFAKFSVDSGGESHDIEGLIHISEIAWEKVDDPNQYVKTGDSLKVKVIGVDENTGKLTLSLKQLLPDPWEDVPDMFTKDSVVKGTVTRVTPYGVFVNLSPGIEGLIHISKITPGEEPKVGDEISCMVEDVQPEKRKISLSMTLTEKPIGYR